MSDMTPEQIKQAVDAVLAQLPNDSIPDGRAPP